MMNYGSSIIIVPFGRFKEMEIYEQLLKVYRDYSPSLRTVKWWVAELIESVGNPDSSVGVGQACHGTDFCFLRFTIGRVEEEG